MDETYLYKEVDFEQYCQTCKYQNTDEAEMPCHECLNNGAALYSHKPVCWAEKED